MSAGWWIVGIIVALVLISSLTNADDESGNGGGRTDFEVARDEFTKATPGSVEGVVAKLIDDANPSAACSAGSCEVTYDGGEVLGAIISPQEELFEDQRYVWQILFEDRALESATLITRGEVESIGGKTSTAPVLRITCNREADSRIDWDDIQIEGVEALCDYQELVDFG